MKARVCIGLALLLTLAALSLPARAGRLYRVPRVNDAAQSASALRVLRRSAGHILRATALGAVPSARTTSLQSAATATGNGTAAEVAGMAITGVYVTITGTATVQFEATIDRTNWFSVGVFPFTGTGTAATQATATGAWIAPVNGASQFRARISSRSSGSITAVAISVPVGAVGAAGSGGGGGGGGAITAASGSYASGAFSAGSGADGWNVTEGVTTGAKAAGDVAGSIHDYLRALSYLSNSVTDTANGFINVNQATAFTHTIDSISAWLNVGGTEITLGQTTMAGAVPVVLPSNQSAIPASQSGTWTVQPGNTANTTPWLVNVSAALPVGANVIGGVTQSGTWTVQPGNTANTTAWKVDGSAVTQPVSGTVTANAGTGTFTAGGVAAHGATVSGNPVLLGAEALSTQRATVTNGQTTRLATDLAGRLITTPFCGPEDILSGTATSTGTGNTSLIAAQAAGVRIYITSCQVSNNSATATEIVLKDGTTALATVPVPAGGGAVIPFPVPLRGTAATAFQFAATVGVTTVTASVQGFRGY